MPAGHGLRSRTRDLFSRGFRQKGYIPLSTYLRVFKVGDYVDIKVNAAVQKVRLVLGDFGSVPQKQQASSREGSSRGCRARCSTGS